MNKEEFYKILENQKAINQDTLPGLKKLVGEYPYFQGAKLLYLKNLKITESNDFDTELKKTAPLIPDRKQLHRILFPDGANSANKFHFEPTGMPLSSYTIGNEGDKSSGNTLIDRFLSSKPGPIKLERPDQKNFPEDNNEIVANSVTEKDEMVTETLAMIFLKQKNYDKALEAFQKLSLKYPEKSVYFASRIEEIEKLKNI